MFNFLFTVVLFRIPCVAGKQQRLIQGDHGLKRSSYQQGISYVNFVAHRFQHLQGSVLDSSCEVVQDEECAFFCVDNAPCVSFNVGVSPNENGKLLCELLGEDKFRSPNKLTDSQQFHHYSIKVNDNLKSRSLLRRFVLLTMIRIQGVVFNVTKRGKMKLNEQNNLFYIFFKGTIERAISLKLIEKQKKPHKIASRY